ncbi:MAG: glycosyltransferase family 4 protein [Chromatiaceae bacterium]|nr:glycosyltransferase family 4 protein [Chromatiaceae bacterium]
MGVKVLVDGQIFDTYPHGGIARIYREVLPKVADLHADWEFAVTVSKAANAVLPVHDRIQVVRWQPLTLRPSRLFSRVNAWRRKRFDRALQAWQPTVFHSTYYTPCPLKGCRSLAMVYDLIDDQFPFAMPNGPGFVSRQGEVLSAADAVVGISQVSTDAAIARFGLDATRTSTLHLDASPVFRVRAASDRHSFRERYTDGQQFILFVGSTGSYKNLATLIRAFAAAEELSDHLLVLAGHSMGQVAAHLFDLAISTRVEQRIVRLVHPTDGQLCLAYNAADAFVFPSLQEGFGIPLIEAMRCGTPVVASDIPVFREVCGDAALFFDPHDHLALARQLARAIQPDTRQRLLDLGFDRAQAFSWDRVADALGQVYLRLAQFGDRESTAASSGVVAL